MVPNETVPTPGDGLEEPLSGPPAGSRRRRRGWRTVGVVAATVVAVLIVQVLVASQLRTPWLAFEPGSATSTEGVLTVQGAQSYDDDGQILYLTVRQNRLTALEWLLRARDPYVDIVREADLNQGRPRSEVREENQAAMQRSKSDAELVALQYLGYDVFATGGAVVAAIEAGTPAEAALVQNEVIIAVDEAPVETREDLIAALRALQPGDTVVLSVQKADGTSPRTVDVTLAARPDGEPGGYLGISTRTHTIEKPDIPVTIAIDSGEVGGNSAGLAFALSIIDAMTPGSLTGGHTVAVTGTIALDGSVGDVGGAAQKAVAARRQGAAYMLVPRNLEAVALKYAGDMQIIPVGTLQEALDALAALGGNADDLALPGPNAAN